jgi:hypothetical protein
MKRAAIESITALSPQDERLQAANDGGAPAPESRALTVVTAAAEPKAPHENPHRSAGFVTQLLAAKAGVPQTRERRREEPGVAAHVYEAHMAPLPAGQGKKLSRAM